MGAGATGEKPHLPEQRDGEQDTDSSAPRSPLLPTLVSLFLFESTRSQMAREPGSEACFDASRVERVQMGSENKYTPPLLFGRVLKRL